MGTANPQEMGRSPALIYDSPKLLIPVRHHISVHALLKFPVVFFPLLVIDGFKLFPLPAIRKSSSYYTMRIQLKIPTL
jgi:hypothetical protein